MRRMRIPEFRVRNTQEKLSRRNRRVLFRTRDQLSVIEYFDFDAPRGGGRVQKDGDVNGIVVGPRHNLNFFDTNCRRSLQPNGLPDSRRVVVINPKRQPSVRLLAAWLSGVLSIHDPQCDSVYTARQI